MVKTEVINKWDIPNAAKFSNYIPTVKGSNGKPLKKIMEQPEKDLILSILNDCHWNRNKAAQALGINRTTLYNKMKKHDIPFEKPKK